MIALDAHTVEKETTGVTEMSKLRARDRVLSLVTPPSHLFPDETWTRPCVVPDTNEHLFPLPTA